ncbi:MAG: SsrA-binding protein [Patescibacteria group bacterium]|nr:SsrA-binding protein [Patescibacteria group bacterium]
MTIIAINKRSSFDYEILEKFEAGLVLSGQETKSIKTGHISLKESFVTIKGSELYLTNAHIPFYKHAGNSAAYDPTRPRKLLLRKEEIKRIIGKARIEGLTLVPIRVYTKKRYLKLEFGIAKGKKKFDKRQDIKRKEAERGMRRMLKSHNT